MLTSIDIKTPTSANVLSTRSPPGALAFTTIGSKLNSPIRCKTPRSWLLDPKQFGCHPRQKAKILAGVTV
jgi:hypothetical protein